MQSLSSNGIAPTAAPWRRRPLACLVAFVVAVTAWRLGVLWFGGLDLGGDEAQYWLWSKDPALGYFSKPPLIAWTIAATTGLCGDGEACIRLSAPLLHAGGAVFTALTAGRLFGRQALWWAGALYATAPGVGFSSLIMTTDALLMFGWAVALYALVRARGDGRLRWWSLLGLACGLGLLSKYAMGYFVACLLLMIAFLPRERRQLGVPGICHALAIAALVATPTLIWNVENGFITVGHVIHNADWDGFDFNVLAALERAGVFLLAQFGVAGPVALAVVVWLAVHAKAYRADDRVVFLWFFSVPVLLFITGQALVSKAFVNWAAAAHIALIVIAAGWLANARKTALAVACVAVNLLATAGLYHYDRLIAPVIASPRLDPLAQFRGWRQVGAEVGQWIAETPDAVIAAGDRHMFALLSYYVRPRPRAFVKWNPYYDNRDDFDRVTSLYDHTEGRFVFVMRRIGAIIAARYFCRRTKIAPVLASSKAPATPPLFVFRASGFQGYDRFRRIPCRHAPPR